jgi:hypothetical protein
VAKRRKHPSSFPPLFIDPQRSSLEQIREINDQKTNG